MLVRHYCEKDKPDIRNICIATANAEKSTRTQQLFLLQLYCDYYIEQEPQNCFVLADDNDEAVGYILCSENFRNYIKTIRPYLNLIKRNSFVRYVYALGEIAAHMPAAKRCRAHMHIDILPAFQYKGYGTRLINTLTDSLSCKGIHSVMLVVSASNTAAVSFYKKNGFKSFINFGKGILMIKSF